MLAMRHHPILHHSPPPTHSMLPSTLTPPLHPPPLPQVDPQFFAFRWITLLLTQEFPFPDAVRIWDTLLSDQGGRGDCLLRVCLAMLINIRDKLLEGEPGGLYEPG